MRDSVYGTVFRVTLGAVLCSIDAAKDITVIRKYYQREEELVGQANALLAMILWNIFVQSFVV